jgi:starch synthase
MPSAEVAPFSKVGGLADVVGSLPPALKKQGVDVRVISPLYKSIDRKKYKLKKIYSDLEIPSGMMILKINIWEGSLPETNVKIYFIDSPEYFSHKEVYISGDNSERFLFFSLASLYALPLIKFIPDILHLQDSHVALMTNIIKTTNLQFLKNIKTLYTIHNFNYQGKTDPEVLSIGNLYPEDLKSMKLDIKDGELNFMVQGILNADLINTVSETYAKEITTSAYGAKLEKIIKKREKDLSGILNGIDLKAFDPQKDKFLIKNYSIKTINKKQENKIALQKKLGLPIDKTKIIVGLVSRLVWQKGLDLITKNFHKLNCQFVFLGTGQKKYEEHLKFLAKKYPKQFSSNIFFDLKLASQIYAGSDIFLMPSRFEPCGLGQMIAMRYGTLPLVRLTGGLKDTVDEKVGFSFNKVSKKELFDTLNRAIDIYYNYPKIWEKMRENAMKKDFSWNKSAGEYIRLYKKLVK